MNKPRLVYLSTAYTFDKDKGAANAVDFLVACINNYDPGEATQILAQIVVTMSDIKKD